MKLPFLALPWSAPDRRPIEEWAADHVELPPALTIRGKFNASLSRHLLEPLAALHSDHVREVNILAPVRGGKTLIADIWVPWIICNDAGPTMWQFQKDDTAKDHCETRLWPTLLACAPVVERLGDVGRHQKRTAEIVFPHMSLFVQGPSVGNLQSKGCRYLINDELWQWESGRLAEAYGRTGDFVRMGIEKVLNLSQANDTGTDWHAKWDASTRHDWCVTCAGCGKSLPLVWTHKRADGTRAGMRWDEHRLPGGDWDVPRCLSSIRYECPVCGHPHIDTARTKSEWNRTGCYVQTNPGANPVRRGYHWPAMIADPWAVLVEEFLGACNAKRRGVLLPLIQFFQKRLAEFMGEARLLETESALPTATYDVQSEWKDEVARFLTVDRQDEDHYWLTVRAWSKSGESRRLHFDDVYGAAAVEEVRERFKVPKSRTFVDSGHEAKGGFGVYAHCAKYGWIATKGSEDRTFTNARKVNGKHAWVHSTYKDPQPASPQVGSDKKCWLILFSADEMKDRVRALIKAGKWKEPANSGNPALDREYGKQMSSEFKKEKVDKFTGRARMVWVCPSKNNHAFDCAALQCLGATILGIIPDVETTSQLAQETATETTGTATQT